MRHRSDDAPRPLYRRPAVRFAVGALVCGAVVAGVLVVVGGRGDRTPASMAPREVPAAPATSSRTTSSQDHEVPHHTRPHDRAGSRSNAGEDDAAPPSEVVTIDSPDGSDATPTSGEATTPATPGPTDPGPGDQDPTPTDPPTEPTRTPTTEPPSAPTLTDDVLVIAEDEPQTIDVIANDAASDGNPVRLVSVSGAANGSASTAGTGSITYTPAADFNGSDEVIYTARDAAGTTANATLSITVEPVNDAPVAADDVVVATQGSESVAVQPLDNDVDIDSDSIWIQSVSQPAHGTAEVTGPDSIAYWPEPGFSGSETFSYVVCDSAEATSTSSITVTIEGDEEAPEPEPELAPEPARSAVDKVEPSAGAAHIGMAFDDSDLSPTEVS